MSRALYVVNELSLARFVASALFGRRPVVLGVAPMLPPLGRLMRRLADRLIARGRAVDGFDLAPVLAHIRAFDVTALIYDVFGETEAWQRRHFRFDRAERRLGEDAMAFKLIVGNYIMEIQAPVLLLEAVAGTADAGPVSIHGATPAMRGLYEAYFGKPFPGRARGGAWAPLVNAALAAAAAAVALAWIASRTRRRAGEADPCFLAADYMGDAPDLRIFDDVRDGGPVVLVARTPDAPPPGGIGADFRRLDARDGRLDPAGAIGAAARVVRDMARIMLCLGRLEPELFRRAAALPFHRVTIRAMLARLRPRFYWGRDSYSPDHVLRSQEMRRIGGSSHVILHGFGTMTDLYPNLRYISCDRFYVFGRKIAELFRDTWDPGMEVVAIGSFNFSRDEIARIRRPPRHGRDIVVLANVLAVLEDAAFVAVVRALAAAFPERTVRLQTKPSAWEKASTRRFLAACAADLANVTPTSAPLAELMEAAACVVSDPSTVVMEALHLGIPAFAVDVMPRQRKYLYRYFPAVRVASADEAVRRVRALLSGAWAFPWPECAALTDLSGGTVFDAVREGFGLPPAAAPHESREAS